MAGEAAQQPTAGQHVRRHLPTCGLGERIGEVRARLDAEPNACIVIHENGVVLGRLGRGALGGDVRGTAAEVMEEGPLTIRPDTPLQDATDRMRQGGHDSLLVTDNDGRLVGALYREDAERALGREPARAGDRG